MTDEGMRLLRELRDYLETAAAVAQHAGLGIIAKAHTHMKNRIVAYLAHPEPQGETPEAERPDLSRCDWCGWPIKESVGEGCVADNCSMRPQPTMTAAQYEVFKMRRYIRSLERRLREAEAHVKELRGRFQLCNEERERQHTRAEAAERGEGMVMVSRSQIEEVIGMAQRFKDIGRRSPHKARMSILEAKLTGWLSAAEEKK